MEPTNEGVSPPIELRTQEQTDGKTCTAHAFINALRLNGTPMSTQEEDALIQKTHERNLESGERASITQQMSVPYEQLSDAMFEVQTPDEAIGLLESKLAESPVVFPISRFLAKRPEAYRESKDNFHAVTAHMKQGKIEVIDPYAPDAPEEFDIQLTHDRQKLLGWFISPYVQHSGASTLDDLTERMDKALLDNKSFGTALRGSASLYQTYSLARLTQTT